MSHTKAAFLRKRGFLPFNGYVSDVRQSCSVACGRAKADGAARPARLFDEVQKKNATGQPPTCSRLTVC